MSNISAILEAGLVAWLDSEIEGCRVVGYYDIDDPARTLPAVVVVCSPAQSTGDLAEIPVRVNILSNAIKDRTRSVVSALMGQVRLALNEDNFEDINQQIDDELQFAGLGEWSEAEADVLETETETTNILSIGCTAYCVVGETAQAEDATITTAA